MARRDIGAQCAIRRYRKSQFNDFIGCSLISSEIVTSSLFFSSSFYCVHLVISITYQMIPVDEQNLLGRPTLSLEHVFQFLNPESERPSRLGFWVYSQHPPPPNQIQNDRVDQRRCIVEAVPSPRDCRAQQHLLSSLLFLSPLRQWTVVVNVWLLWRVST